MTITAVGTRLPARLRQIVAERGFGWIDRSGFQNPISSRAIGSLFSVNEQHLSSIRLISRLRLSWWGALETTLRISYSYRELSMEPASALETTSWVSYSYRELGASHYKRADSEALVKGLVPKVFAIVGICLLLIGLIEALKFVRDCPKFVRLALANPPCVYHLHGGARGVAEMPPVAINDLETSLAHSGGCRC
jgi:hypothetical protein